MANKRIWPVYILLTLPLVSNECPLVQHSLLRSDTFIFYYYYYYYYFFFFLMSVLFVREVHYCQRAHCQIVLKIKSFLPSTSKNCKRLFSSSFLRLQVIG